MLESKIVRDLISRENLSALREYAAGTAGFVDILTKREIIEVKELKNWKAAIGQVICYSIALNDAERCMRIHLFKRDGSIILPSEVEQIERICSRLNIRLTYEGGSFIRDHISKRVLDLDRYKFKPA